MRLINVDALITDLIGEDFNEHKFCYPCKEVLKKVKGQPVVDAVPVVHGRWIYGLEPYPLGNPYGHYECSQCGESVPGETNYCPHCGAKMDGGDYEST